MKTTLYFRDTKSDKVYSGWLKPFGNDLYDVSIEYGRRGGTLATGIKTPDSLPLADAQKVFDRLIAEKKSKGYTESPDGQPFNGDPAKLAEVLPHPAKTIVSRAEMQSIVAGGNHIVFRKYDGELARRELLPGVTVLGEKMRRKSGGHHTASDTALFALHGEFFAVFRLASIGGENWLTRSNGEAWEKLKSIAVLLQTIPGVILAETVLDVAGTMARGAEGVVAHPCGGNWGFMLAHKVEQIYECTVTHIGGTQSAEIRVHDTGALCRVKLGGGKIDQCRVGSVIRVGGLGPTDDGKIRQPVACREWLVQF